MTDQTGIVHDDQAHAVRASGIVTCLACDDEDYARPCPAREPVATVHAARETSERAARMAGMLAGHWAVITHVLARGQIMADQVTRCSVREISDYLELGSRAVDAFAVVTP